MFNINHKSGKLERIKKKAKIANQFLKLIIDIDTSSTHTLHTVLTACNSNDYKICSSTRITQFESTSSVQSPAQVLKYLRGATLSSRNKVLPYSPYLEV